MGALNYQLVIVACVFTDLGTQELEISIALDNCRSEEQAIDKATDLLFNDLAGMFIYVSEAEVHDWDSEPVYYFSRYELDQQATPSEEKLAV